jgi:hypothetical protein
MKEFREFGYIKYIPSLHPRFQSKVYFVLFLNNYAEIEPSYINLIINVVGYADAPPCNVLGVARLNMTRLLEMRRQELMENQKPQLHIGLI